MRSNLVSPLLAAALVCLGAAGLRASPVRACLLGVCMNVEPASVSEPSEIEPILLDITPVDPDAGGPVTWSRPGAPARTRRRGAPPPPRPASYRAPLVDLSRFETARNTIPGEAQGDLEDAVRAEAGGGPAPTDRTPRPWNYQDAGYTEWR